MREHKYCMKVISNLLDVYKRQIMDEAVESLMAGPVIVHKKHETDISPAQFLKFSSGSITEQSPCEDNRIEPVSYTHLDVYKRQLLYHVCVYFRSYFLRKPS